MSLTDSAVIWGSIEAFESGLMEGPRRQGGVHYTPRVLAEYLAARAIDAATASLGRPVESVCDPACGAGAFLVAAADRLHEIGLDPVDIVSARLRGFDVDLSAVAVAREVLISWARMRVGDESLQVEPNIQLRDGLDPDLIESSDSYELVIGNPPFLSQLRSDTSIDRQRMERLSEHLGGLDPYVDASALFLALASRSTAQGGIVSLIQPQSFLSVKGSQGVRDSLLEDCELVSIWSSAASFFKASVRVCAVTVRSVGERRTFAASEPSPSAVKVSWGGDRRSMSQVVDSSVDSPARGASWGPLLAESVGIPSVDTQPLHTMWKGSVDPANSSTVPFADLRLGDIATATAGFRDEYYALVDSCVEQNPGDMGDSSPRLVTVGMLSPFRSDWGSVTARIGGRQWTRPTVDTDRLDHASGRVARWAHRRMVPKVLVATQSRVVEAAADPDGRDVPLTPLIAVEPLPDWLDRLPGATPQSGLWWIVAALSAPPVSAIALAANLGSGLSVQSLRWSAKSILDLSLPSEAQHWAAGAELAQQLSTVEQPERRALLEQFGRSMCLAYRVRNADAVLDWWLERASRA